jgi:hypothetical protein
MVGGANRVGEIGDGIKADAVTALIDARAVNVAALA